MKTFSFGLLALSLVFDHLFTSVEQKRVFFLLFVVNELDRTRFYQILSVILKTVWTAISYLDLKMFGPISSSVFLHIAEVTDHLFLCGARGVNAHTLRERGVTCVVNATVELPNLPIGGVEFVKVDVSDTPFADLGAHFDRIADKIDDVRERGGKTLVHCVAGVSRSASLCIAYLMKYKGMSLRDAYHYVKERRPIVRPNNGFFRQLIEYEAKLYERETVKLVASHAGMIPDVYEQEYRNLILLTTPPVKLSNNNYVEPGKT